MTLLTSNAYSPPEGAATLADLGQRFRALRKAAGKTQTEVARAVGMRQEALSRFESGRAVDFSLSKLLRLLQVLDLALDFKPVVRRPSLGDVLREVRQGHNTGPNAR
jgi:HTH-type transcriptional regulator / antitoxin HipB